MSSEFGLGDTVYFDDVKCSYNALPPYNIIRKGIIISYDDGVQRYEVSVSGKMFFYLKAERLRKTKQI